MQTKATQVSERTKQEAETAGRKWLWVEASIWTERMLSALENGVKGSKWFSLIDKVYRPKTLQLAWERVAANKGAAGIDKVSIERFAAQAQCYLEELEQQLKAGSYKPEAIKRVEIPKGDGKMRPLGIPTVKDRIVQTAVKLVIEPIYEVQFQAHSYGFRPQRGCKDALREVDRLLKEGYVHVVDADLQTYFDSIPHAKLMQRMEERIADGAVLNLLGQFLEQDILQDMNKWKPTAGSPQGSPLSPLLSNIYLHGLDVRMGARGYRMVRYCDDFVILCRGQEEAHAALQEVREWVDENELKLHPEKTHVANCMEKGQGFEFLGYRFEAGKREVRPKSLKKMKDKIREKTRRTQGTGLAAVIADLNPMLRGWFGYFQHANSRTFRTLDAFIRRRLRSMLRKQEKRPGFGRTCEDHRQWPNAFFAQVGLFTLHTTWQAARQSRCGNY